MAVDDTPHGEDPPAPSRPRDGVSIAAFAFSLVGAGLVAVPLAVWGLTRTGGDGRRGRGFAVAALALSVAWALIGVVLVFRPAVLGSQSIAAAVRGEPTAAPVGSATPADPGPTGAASPTPDVDERVERVYWEELEAGMCVRVPADAAVDIPVVDCRAEHDEEVLARTVLTGPDEWPGDGAMEAAADTKCRAAFADHIGIGYDDSRLELDFWTNDEEGWAQGRRTLVCLAYDPSSPTLTETLAGSAE